MTTPDVSQLVDIEQGLIRGEIFHSSEIYQAELEQVFARSWLFLAHDSMIPKAGDFIQVYMGEDPVVVVRQRDGSVKAFLNQCRHRGMRICRVDRGNTKAFMCSFHGWTYDTAGSLTHVPHQEEAYPQGLDTSRLGPRQVPMMANYKGFIFGNWDPTAPPFEEYLGDMAWYFDAYHGRYEGGVEAVALHKWVMPCNWKFNAEQPSGDAYHGEITHASAFQVLGHEIVEEGGDKLADHDSNTFDGFPFGTQFSAPYGHGGGWLNTSFQPSGPLEQKWRREMRPEAVSRVGPVRAVAVAAHANIFPNFSMLGNGTMRVTHPRGPEEMEVWSWTFVPVAAPPEVKDEIRKEVLRTFSPGGMLEQDDAENWVEEQRILRGYVARQNQLVYMQHLGAGDYDVNGFPGKTAPHIFAEMGPRGLYEHWMDMMSGMPWSDIVETKRQRVAAERRRSEARMPSTS
ncbi:aromatic ring-hydroxylating dioxygenase subunit alpha [Streptomyces sp. NPDC090106]|uniref:aromatic ring-hydroxylating oxygenase subunit alpha n=1 Tax=Streptomyces sp. NPDC090106 TaxID=3365946 RepID=UPI003806DB06